MSRIQPCRSALALLLISIVQSQVRAAGSETQPLADMSLEDLMKVEVSSVSRREKTMAQTPAAVFVISQDDIRRSGASTIPDLLRMVPGVQVARLNSSQWAVSSRGFNSRLSDMMQVLIDGRSVYNHLYSGVMWDQNDVMLEDIERIEVIRGPGATMWGANAVNGVINIITKKAADTQGGLLSASGGKSEYANGAVRYGGSAGDDVHYRAWTKYFNRGAMLRQNGRPSDDAWNEVRGGGRIDWQASSRDWVTFHGDVYCGSGREELYTTAPFGSGPTGAGKLDFSGGYGMARWERRLDHSDFALQTYYDRETRDEGMGAGTLQTVDFDFQHHIPAGRHDLMWGAGYRLMDDYLDKGRSPFLKDSYRDSLFNGFVQDDISLVPSRLVLSAGMKLEHNAFTGLELQPGVRILWTPDSAQSFWASVSRAVRSPSIRDRELFWQVPVAAPGPLPQFVRVEGSSQFKSEVVYAYEAGFRRQISSRLSVDVAGFANRYTSLRGTILSTASVQLQPMPAIVVPMLQRNALRAFTYGLETSVTWNPARIWRLQAGHSWLGGGYSTYNSTGLPIAGTPDLYSPRNTYTLRSALDLTHRLALDSSLYCVSRLTYLKVPSYPKLDLQATYKLSESVEVRAGVDDLLRSQHLEFISVADYVSSSLMRRSAFVKFIWKF